MSYRGSVFNVLFMFLSASAVLSIPRPTRLSFSLYEIEQNVEDLFYILSKLKSKILVLL